MNMLNAGLLALLVASAGTGMARAEDAPAAGTGAGTAAGEEPLDPGLFKGAHILLPDGPIAGQVFLFSDAAGWGAADARTAKRLVREGAAVVGIDLPTFVAAVEAVDDECVYTISDVEALSQQIQRTAGSGNYHPPILAGLGEGGAMAMALMSQTPAATVASALAVDPTGGIRMKRPLCTDATSRDVDGRTIYSLSDDPLPAPILMLFTPDASTSGKALAEELNRTHPDVGILGMTAPARAGLERALSVRIGAASGIEDPLGLPLTLLPAGKPASDTLAVIYSGDGGWRDIDKQLGGYLQSKGVPVVGVDSLRYFWSKRGEQETADDLARMIETFTDQWGVSKVALIGYSFGADILPAAYNRLPDDMRERVSLVSLLAPSHKAAWEISISGWLGGEGSGEATLPEMVRIPAPRLMCVYGEEEGADSACPKVADKGAEIVKTGGGHHFDGDYKALGEKLTDAIRRRAVGP